jgi:PIN domain nuclease of toxin-antitoxin system
VRILLDTHTVLWWLDSPEKLGTTGYALIADPHNILLISPVVPWEIALKANKYKTKPHALVTDFHFVVQQQGFTAIQVDPLHAIRSGLLPFHHRDPFDRLLAAQSLELDVPLISIDAVFDRYGVTRICKRYLVSRLLEIDLRVVQIILRVFEDQGAVGIAELAAHLRGNAGPEGARRDDGVLGENCAGGDYRPLADVAIVQYRDAHTDEHRVLDTAAVDGGIVTDGDPVADLDTIEMALAVEDGAVLDVGVGSDADRVHIAAQDGVHPDRGVFAEGDVADHLGGEIDITTGGNLG